VIANLYFAPQSKKMFGNLATWDIVKAVLPSAGKLSKLITLAPVNPSFNTFSKKKDSLCKFQSQCPGKIWLFF